MTTTMTSNEILQAILTYAFVTRDWTESVWMTIARGMPVSVPYDARSRDTELDDKAFHTSGGRVRLWCRDGTLLVVDAGGTIVGFASEPPRGMCVGMQVTLPEILKTLGVQSSPLTPAQERVRARRAAKAEKEAKARKAAWRHAMYGPN